MVDCKHQCKGIGKTAMQLLVKEIKAHKQVTLRHAADTERHVFK